MPLHVRKPSASVVQRLLLRTRDEPFSYPEVGATEAERLPRGYAHATWSEELGTGDAVYEAAVEALRSWRMFDLGWVRLHGAVRPPAVGDAVAPIAHRLGLWSLNVARVVYVVDGADECGFAYGTLAAHAERGEERFEVARRSDGSVVYRMRVFSRPQAWWARLGGRYVVRQQQRFREESGAAMKRAVTAAV